MTEEQFENDVFNGDRLWVVEFMANWCGGCRMVRPWYIETAAKLKGDIPLGALDTDGPGRKFMDRYGVSGMPHIMAFVPGKEEPVGMGGLGGAPSILAFAKEQWNTMSPEQQQAHKAAMKASGTKKRSKVPANECHDKSAECPDWKKNMGGNCNGQDYSYMKKHCPKTCGMCEEATAASGSPAEEAVVGGGDYALDDPDADHREHAIEMDEAGDLAAAIASFRAAAKFSPEDSSSHFNLGTALLESAAETEQDHGDTAEAERLRGDAMLSFQQAVALDPTDDEARETLESVIGDIGKVKDKTEL